MKFELEYEVASKRLRKILRQYGSYILENPFKCHAFWGDLAPDLPDEGKALDEFLAAGLGNSVVALDEEDISSCKEWKQRAVDTLSSRGMERKEAVSLVEMVMYALSLEAEGVTADTAAAAVKPVMTVMPVQQKNTTDGNDIKNKYILLQYYLPILFPEHYYISPTPIPSDVLEVVRAKIGREKLNKLTILAYGYDSDGYTFFLFTDEGVIFRSVRGDSENYEFLYSAITKVSLSDGAFCVSYKNGRIVEEISYDFGGKDFFMADLLSCITGVEKPEIYVGDISIFIGNKLREYKADAFGIYDKQKGIPGKKLKNVCESLEKANYKLLPGVIEAVIDETVMGSCKNYIAFTDTEIFSQYNNGKVYHVKYHEIVSMKANGKLSEIIFRKQNGVDVCIRHVGNRNALIKAIYCIKSVLGHSRPV